MHLKLTINGTAFTVATVRIVGKQSSQLPWANFLLARDSLRIAGHKLI
jgi:hypothetical protein